MLFILNPQIKGNKGGDSCDTNPLTDPKDSIHHLDSPVCPAAVWSVTFDLFHIFPCLSSAADSECSAANEKQMQEELFSTALLAWEKQSCEMDWTTRLGFFF